MKCQRLAFLFSLFALVLFLSGCGSEEVQEETSDVNNAGPSDSGIEENDTSTETDAANNDTGIKDTGDESDPGDQYYPCLKDEECKEPLLCINGFCDYKPEEPVEEEPVIMTCEELGLISQPFQEVPETTTLFAISADFTLPTTRGDWNFKTKWSGCDVYLFIQDKPQQNTGFDTAFWELDVPALLSNSPKNVHYFFIPTAVDETVIAESLSTIKNAVTQALKEYSGAEKNNLKGRMHYVTQPVSKLTGWLDSLMKNPGWGIGIDRFQRIRYIGSYSDPLRYDATQQWFAPNLSMAANEAIYYNFEAEREERLNQENATVITLFNNELLSDPDWSGKKGFVEVELPPPEQMAKFDTMEFDLYLGCNGKGERGTCPAWDYIANLYLCDKDNPDVCDVELGRWITTYHRIGRWVHDVSGLLPYLKGGGKRRFAFYTQQPYIVKLSLRLSSKSSETKPSEAIYLFSGGGFDLAYNDKYEPITVSITPDVKKVMLATVISGHGMSEPGNCAEFCNTSHHFIVNGTDSVISFPVAGTYRGCMDMITEGTIPNQYGTWWYGRSGWCPGKEVPMVMTDVTAQVNIGGDNTFEYNGFYKDAPYSGSGASIQLTSWVVLYK